MCQFEGGDRERVGEYLRHKCLRSRLEECNIVVVGSNRSQKKYNEGECRTVNGALGFSLDFSNPDCRRIGLKGDKLVEYHRMVVDLRKRAEERKRLPFKDVGSVAHKLNHARQVILRGKICTGGLFAAIRGIKESGWVNSIGGIGTL